MCYWKLGDEELARMTMEGMKLNGSGRRIKLKLRSEAEEGVKGQLAGMRSQRQSIEGERESLGDGGYVPCWVLLWEWMHRNVSLLLLGRRKKKRRERTLGWTRTAVVTGCERDLTLNEPRAGAVIGVQWLALAHWGLVPLLPRVLPLVRSVYLWTRGHLLAPSPVQGRFPCVSNLLIATFCSVRCGCCLNHGMTSTSLLKK